MSARFRLRRPDGKIYLERWGFELGKAGRWGGVFIHHISAPDPGVDLHDHPWWFASLVLKGGYIEVRKDTRLAINGGLSGPVSHRKRWSWRSLPRTVCHSIINCAPNTWTLVIHGPRRGDWGFYTPMGWIFHLDYGDERRGLKTEAIEGAVD